jgi:AraC-like DNA-binding protein
MAGHQDTIALSPSFPFEIMELALLPEPDPEESFHWHNYYEITLILEGTGCYYVNGHALEVAPGDIMIFNNAELHGWQVFDPGLRVLVMVFSSALVAGYGDFSETAYLRPFVERDATFQNRVPRENPAAAQIAEMMREIRGEWKEKTTGYPLMIRADVLRILTLLVRHFHAEGRGASPSDRCRALLRLMPALEYIDTNFGEKLTLKETADLVYMSPNYFSHYFHTATGVSFSDYVSMRRVRQARELLETTGLSIYEIAVSCGFHNSSNFYRLYKKHTGGSPRKSR